LSTSRMGLPSDSLTISDAGQAAAVWKRDAKSAMLSKMNPDRLSVMYLRKSPHKE
jgi:hypothetical protein